MKRIPRATQPVRRHLSWRNSVLMLMVCGIGWLAFDYRIDHLPEAKSEQPKVDFGEVERFESSRKRNPNDSQSAFIDSSQIEATLSAMTHDQLMDGKTQTLISSWASAHPHDAKKWVLVMGNAQLRQPLAQVVALGIAKTEPRMAAMFVVNDFLPGNQQDESLVAVVGEWAKRDPNLVAEWLLEFPHDSMGGSAINAFVSTWADQDSKAAGVWLSSLPPSPFRNTGLVAYINSVRRFDEKLAEEFVALIELHR